MANLWTAQRPSKNLIEVRKIRMDKKFLQEHFLHESF